jgi:hypothetical protein
MKSLILNKRLLVVTPLILLLMIIAYQAFNRGISDIYFTNVEYILRSPISSGNLQKAQQQLEIASTISVGNPKYYRLKGIVDSWKSNTSSDASNTEKLLTLAKNNYIQSLLLQPDNPYTWLNFAKISYYQNNNNYRIYLNRALKYGKSQQRILLEYINLMLLDWHKMNKKDQDEIVNLIQNLILAKDFLFKTSGKRLNNILKAQQLKFILCSKMIRSKKIQLFCKIKS